MRAGDIEYGVADGVPTLFFYQTGGRSRSGKPLGWRNAVLAEIRSLRMLEERFAGTRLDRNVRLYVR